jgi:predicted lipoprotein
MIIQTNEVVDKSIPAEVIKAARKILKDWNVPDDQVEVWIKNQPELLAKLKAAYQEEVRK